VLITRYNKPSSHHWVQKQKSLTREKDKQQEDIQLLAVRISVQCRQEMDGPAEMIAKKKNFLRNMIN
jgi:hypothetical protein